MFKNSFSFNGRIRRLEYGLSVIAYFLGLFAIVLILDVFDSPRSGLATVFTLVTYIPLCWFLLAQGAKRCHDRGNPGVWQIIPFYYWWMVFADGEIGDNEYGPNPKGLSNDFDDSGGDSIIIEPIDDVDEDGIIRQ